MEKSELIVGVQDFAVTAIEGLEPAATGLHGQMHPRGHSQRVAQDHAVNIRGPKSSISFWKREFVQASQQAADLGVTPRQIGYGRLRPAQGLHALPSRAGPRSRPGRTVHSPRSP